MSDAPSSPRRRTPLHDRHAALGGKTVDFAGWDMPVQYATGTVAEHLATRKAAGLFDVSHMGRFRFRGAGAVALLQQVLTNDAATLAPWTAQYTLIPTPTGGALDDAFLYRLADDEFLLVVNAANRQADWDHLQAVLACGPFDAVDLTDITGDLAMLALQGPQSESILKSVLTGGALPKPVRNAAGEIDLADTRVTIARTGYTGEPVCFELFVPAGRAEHLWDVLTDAGAAPIGLGARDTLRLEAALPLYGHELGTDPNGNEIPIMACPASRLGVNLSGQRDLIGRAALEAQMQGLPRRILPLALLERGVAREGATVSKDGRPVGVVTSGTMAPYWTGEDTHALRPVSLAYVDSGLGAGDEVHVEVRGKRLSARIVTAHVHPEGARTVAILPDLP